MTLILQIAAGIVLGGLVLRYLERNTPSWRPRLVYLMRFLLASLVLGAIFSAIWMSAEYAWDQWLYEPAQHAWRYVKNPWVQVILILIPLLAVCFWFVHGIWSWLKQEWQRANERDEHGRR